MDGVVDGVGDEVFGEVAVEAVARGADCFAGEVTWAGFVGFAAVCACLGAVCGAGGVDAGSDSG